METICLIVSGLALLAATVSLALLVREITHSRKRNAAALQYTDNSREQAIKAAESMLWCQMQKVQGQLDATRQRLEKLEAGAVPDYEAQKNACDAVNEFARGVSAILGFDPMESLRKEQENGKRG